MSHWERSGRSDQWYTPKYVFDALGCTFYMDVAAPHLIPSYIGDLLTRRDGPRWLWKDSLESDWLGFVWMNPPYGGRNSLTAWLDKFVGHGNGIALVPDRTSAPWFRAAFPAMDAVMFTPKIRFLRPDGSEGKSPSNGSALMAIGEHGVAALHNAARNGLGILATPISARRAP
ncbi:MAG: DNA N-6-adenine-methyltransferase [Pseudomonadota bacterium]